MSCILEKMHTFVLISLFLFLNSSAYAANTDSETKKTYLEDIFIWKISDELKLSVKEEIKFTEIHKSLNKKKSELNKQIQDLTLGSLNKKDISLLRQKIIDYNQISISEFDSMRKLLGDQKFVSYLQIKSELTNKVKTLLTGEKPNEKEKKESASSPLAPPEVIIEKNEKNE